MAKQLTAFMENRAGRLQEIARILADEAINILSFNLAETTSFGVLRMIVSDSEKGLAALHNAGISAQLNEVIAVEIPSRPGSMSQLLATLPEDISIEYLYPYDTSAEHSGVILKLNDMVEGSQRIRKAGYTIL